MMLAFMKIKKKKTNRTVWCFFHDTDGESGLLIIYTVTDLGKVGGGGGCHMHNPHSPLKSYFRKLKTTFSAFHRDPNRLADFPTRGTSASAALLHRELVEQKQPRCHRIN